MKKTIISALVLLASLSAGAMNFDKTLRLNYIFSGTDKTAEIALAELCSIDGWAGRRVNMDRVALKGNGQLCMKDAATGAILYRNSFSTLFQEWQNSEEAVSSRQAFENVFLVPMPEGKAEITVELYDNRGAVIATLTHPVDPSDILIRPTGRSVTPHKYLHRSGDSSEKIDIAIVAEGYSAEESELFYEDAEKAMNDLWSHEPFSSLKDRFNIVAVAAVSAESGISVPHEGKWLDTALGSHFDTFYSDRYLTTLNLFRLHDVLAGIAYEHIIILANTDTYGGGGIFNSYVLSSAHNKFSSPVIVHEFGHSFAGLADEYFYDDQYTEFYYPDTEPWEPNITTLADFSCKWQDMIGRDGVDLYEGAGYQSKGVFRSSKDCRMQTNLHPSFCPVCERAIRDIISFYTEQRD